MGKFLPLLLGWAGLVALACGAFTEEKDWVRESDVAYVDCHVAEYRQWQTEPRRPMTGTEREVTAFSIVGMYCSDLYTEKRTLQSYKEHVACKIQVAELYRQGDKGLSQEEAKTMEERIDSAATFICYPEGRLQDLPGAPEPTARPRITPEPEPTPTPTPIRVPTSTPRPPTPTPEPQLEPSLKHIPEGYPFTINIPGHWLSKVNTTDNVTEYRFGDPDSHSAIIIVTAIHSEFSLPFDSEGLADITLKEIERRSVEGTFQLKSRTTTPDGSVRLSLSFHQQPLCHQDSVGLVDVVSTYAFSVEASVCKDEWDKYEALLTEAVGSFAVKPSMLR